MSFDRAVVGLPDLKNIEGFLMNLPDVLDASVWISNDRLLAHVTVPMGVPIVPNTVRAACLKELGVHCTPDEVFLIVEQALVA